MSDVRSMTGFAATEVVGDAGLQLMIKGVNHRFLDLSFRLPPGCDALEMRLRRVLKERLRRGHVDLTMGFERRAEGTHAVNEAVLAKYLEAIRAAAKRHALAGEPELTALLRLPGVLHAETGAGTTAMSPETEERVVEALGRLLDEFDRSRLQEGAALAAAIDASLRHMRTLSAEARVLREGVREAHLQRLHARIGELLADAGEISEARLLTEAALLAERSDVDEELLRLEAHIDSFAAALRGGGELGKRLDFLSQEMNREANTVLSKTGSAAGRDGLRLTEIGLLCKGEIERVREQVQNIE